MWEPQYDYLEHHGIRGQRWGVRRYQNPDGSLTPEGKARRDKYAERIIADINKGNLNLKSRGYDPFSLKGSLSKGYILKSADKDKKLKRAKDELLKHPSSKKAEEAYQTESVRFVDRLLGERRDALISFNNQRAREYIAYNFFNVKLQDIAKIDQKEDDANE